MLCIIKDIGCRAVDRYRARIRSGVWHLASVEALCFEFHVNILLEKDWRN